MVIEVEVRKNTENELVGNTINFPGIVCSSGETEPELRKNIVDAINQTIDVALEEGKEQYKQYANAFGLKLIFKEQCNGHTR